VEDQKDPPATEVTSNSERMSYLGHRVLQGIGVFALSELLVGGVKGHNNADSYQQSLHRRSSEFGIDAARPLTERPCSLKSRIFRLSSSVASRLLATRQGRNVPGKITVSGSLASSSQMAAIITSISLHVVQ